MLERLGSGGMGTVYKAEDINLGRLVALKFLAEEFVGSPGAIERLKAEARAASTINHPNVCTIYEIANHEKPPFLAMEFVDGETLAARIGGQPLKVADVLAITAQVAQALASLHEAGVVHRDIKPSNIMLRGLSVKLLDFGIAASPWSVIAGGGSDGLCAGLGTLHYMSPEQAETQPIDHRSDIFQPRGGYLRDAHGAPTLRRPEQR